VRHTGSWNARVVAFVALGVGLAPALAAATGFTDIGQDLEREPEMAVRVHGYLRVRTEALYNLDLDRGLTPSGQSLFPVPLSDPSAQTLTHADMRLRGDLAFYVPRGGVAVKVRLDLLDNVALGSAPIGDPQASSGQGQPKSGAVVLRRAYGEALTPFGMLVAGRTGSTWGLGMLANGGDCADCDHGDAADRIAFITPLFGHIFALAYDFSAVEALTTRPGGVRTVDIDPSTDVRTITFAMLRWRDDVARERRRRAGKITVEYGAYVSYRWQGNDIPSTYAAVLGSSNLAPSQVMHRGYEAAAVDGWLRLTTPRFRLEWEGAAILGRVEQSSLLPGALFREPIKSRQFGTALESEVGRPEGRLGAGLDLGFASGDPAPGFGVFPRAGQAAPKTGDLDGAQAAPPRDNRIDNFRFHPDYRIDQILFREIIGAVTDAFYLRPHARWRLMRLGPGTLTAAVALIASFAACASSTPGGKHPLGLEIDPTVVYAARDGFQAALEYAVLFPFAGLDNPVAGLAAKPAQLVRLRLAYVF
jgi:uncharacterized protein (TIGR04551 family)